MVRGWSGAAFGPPSKRPLELCAAGEMGEYLHRSGDPAVKVLERELPIGVNPLDRQLAGRPVPAHAVASSSVVMGAVYAATGPPDPRHHIRRWSTIA